MAEYVFHSYPKNPSTRNPLPLSMPTTNISLQTVMAPLAALTMAGLLFVYARTSIRAAKLNAQKHREADGGQISWHKESMRCHGTMERLDDDRSTFKEALMGDVTKSRKERRLEEEERERERLRAKLGGSENDRELRGMLGKKD